MKLKFKNQEFQTHAVNSVVGLFAGQQQGYGTFTVTPDEQISMMGDDGLGYSNILTVPEEQIISNMQAVQRHNSLAKTESLEGRQFSIEMETGTGKTYVYIKTIFELNKQYGFKKFIIVVPSVAIREGVYKTFEITEEHFRLKYENVPYRYFIYNSAKLSNVRDYATSADIEVMIINIDAFKKSENVINQEHEKMNGETAMKFIQDANPIVIIDEPQSVDNTDKAKDAIASLNPLCVLRYSATHREKVNLLYRLTSVDAYQLGLVKQICVSSNEVHDEFNKPYIRLISVSAEKGFSARIEIDVKGADGTVSRKAMNVKHGVDLEIKSGDRDIYAGYIINGIDATPGNEHIEFGNNEHLAVNKAIGYVDEMVIKRKQIYRTIETHLEKELRYLSMEIKVLSLFFIDQVKNYRLEDGGHGIYAEIFEECYAELIEQPRFEKLKERFTATTAGIHDGYFSQDKKGGYKDTKGDTVADFDTYATIMQKKEWLLSFDCPLRFIWSHSALKEGWDNPNVFQVCTLIEQKSVFTARQKVGRGLRLCVNQDGERIEDRNINILHVMANERFSEFAETLQNEIEQETGLKFGMLDIGVFQDMTYTDMVVEQKIVTQPEAEQIMLEFEKHGLVTPDGQVTDALIQAATDNNAPVLLLPELQAKKEVIEQVARHIAEQKKPVTPEIIAGASYTQTMLVEKQISYDEAAEIVNHFEKIGYTKGGKQVKDTLKNDLANGTLDLPPAYEAAKKRFVEQVSRAIGGVPIHNDTERVTVRLKKGILLDERFLAIWDRIKHRTVYRVNVDSAVLKTNCIESVKTMQTVPKAKIATVTVRLDIHKSGVSHTQTGLRTDDIEEENPRLLDIIRIIANECRIKRSDCYEILDKSGRIEEFFYNPQQFLEQVTEIIKAQKRDLEIAGISYKKLADKEYYEMDVFANEELTAFLGKNAVKVENSIYDYVVYDSTTVEKPFAQALDEDKDVRMFFKLPPSFSINTPLGSYNPDWAVFLEENGVEKMYFVIETKGSTNRLDLRYAEDKKIHCGIRHFESLDSGVEQHLAKNWTKFRLGN